MATRTQERSASTGIRIEPSAKRVRTYLGGEAVADTTRPLLVWEIPYHPTYYFPELLEAARPSTKFG